MNRLRGNTFFVLWMILTIFALTLLFIFNHQIYQREEKSVVENMSRINAFSNSYLSDRFPILMDTSAYVVHFNKNNTISKIVSFTTDGLSSEEISTLAVNYMNKKSKSSNNLYVSEYLYSVNGNSLVIFDNSNTRLLLNGYLRITLIIFILFELINVGISWKLTRWLVIPVIESFNNQKQFIYDVSHELKTPIAVIMANADMAEENPKETKWINNIKNESDRMNKLVVSLLDLLMSDNINERETFSKVNLSKTIEMCVLTFESLIYENNLKLDYEIDQNIMINCNNDRIKQLFGILVDNAIKHAKSESKISIKLKKTKEGILFSVKNRGDAIPLEDREKIFDRFYRVDKSRNRNENRYGLGLAIAKNIVTSHNGKIKVDCTSGYTTFTVIFKN